VANGIVDAWVHTTEQYLTYPADAPLQDRQAEAILLTLLGEGPKALAEPEDYAVRANLMWCATQALNGLIGCGVPQDWATHMIGHELTALYGIDHAQSLAVVLPGVLRAQKGRKRAKLLQYAERVWGLGNGDEDARIEQAVEKTEQFFRSLGVGTRLADYQISDEAVKLVAARLVGRGMKLGEYQDLGEEDYEEIVAQRK
jgi:NADP-dependent alcohol dehydrogenase